MLTFCIEFVELVGGFPVYADECILFHLFILAEDAKDGDGGRENDKPKIKNGRSKNRHSKIRKLCRNNRRRKENCIENSRRNEIKIKA